MKVSFSTEALDGDDAVSVCADRQVRTVSRETRYAGREVTSR